MSDQSTLNNIEAKKAACFNYYLLLLSPLTLSISFFVSIIVAYVYKKGTEDAIWKSHFTCQVRVFWLAFVLAVLPTFFLAVLLTGLKMTSWMPIIWIFPCLAYLWILLKSIQGLRQARCDKPLNTKKKI